ncbi:MAG: CHAT domain-containing protein [Fimbriimonadaceae bacterium]|nr:CHAT domain-containing protein [Chitinophagales bacterium]
MQQISVILFLCFLSIIISCKRKNIEYVDNINPVILDTSAIRTLQIRCNSFLEINNYDSFTVYKIQIADLYEESDSLGGWLQAYDEIMTRYRKDAKQYDKTILYYNLMLRNIWRLPADELSYDKLANMHRQMGYLYGATLNLWYVAVGYYEKGIATMDAGNLWTPYKATLFLKSYGSGNTRLGEHEKASAAFKKYISICGKGSDTINLAQANNEFGKVYEDKGDTVQAIKYYKNAYDLSEKKLTDSRYVEEAIIATLNLASIYTSKFIDSAHYYNTKTFDLINIWNNKEDDEIAAAYISRGEIAASKNNYPDAVKYFSEGIYLYQKNDAKKNRRYLAKAKISMGKCYLQQLKYETAGVQFKESLQNSIPAYKSVTKAGAINDSLLMPENSILEACEGLGDAYTGMFGENNNILDLEVALQQYISAIKIEILLRKLFQNESSKLTLLKKGNKLHEKAFETAKQLYRKTYDKKYLQQMFWVSETSKYSVLLDSYVGKKATALFNNTAWKNDSLLAEINPRLKQLEFQLRYAEDDGEKNILKNELHTLSVLQDSLQKILHQNNPAYYQAKYAYTVSSLNDLKQSMDTNQLVITYFTTSDTVYTITVSKNDVSFYSIANDSAFNTSLNYLLSYISNSNSYSQKQYDSYITASKNVYNYILKPVLQKQNGIKNCIIIPDKKLSLLPFDVLATDTNKYNDINDATYLVQKYNVSYAFSASVYLQKPLEHLPQKRTVIAFSPSFKSNKYFTERDCFNANVASLLFNRKETASITNLLSGKDYSGDAATVKNFLQQANEYAVIHIASHACVNYQNSAASQIAFSDTILFASDIYYANLNAQLVTLSACNTGTGKLETGEGMMSLSRAFAYAGCPSVVMSLWSANDESTSKIMEYFYAALKTGNKKDEALRLAKLKYLEQADTFHKQPFFWASFMVIGDTESIDFQNSYSNKFLPYIIFSILLLAFLFFVKRMKRNR